MILALQILGTWMLGVVVIAGLASIYGWDQLTLSKTTQRVILPLVLPPVLVLWLPFVFAEVLANSVNEGPGQAVRKFWCDVRLAWGDVVRVYR